MAVDSVGGMSSVQQLVEQTIQYERRPVVELEDSKKSLNNRMNILKDLKTKLKSLRDLSKDFTQVGRLNNLLKKTATSSDEKYFTVSATADADPTSHTIKVNQLASVDTGISKQFTNLGTNLATSSVGLQEFSVAMGDNDAVTVSITIDAADTNKDVLVKIKDAVNEASDDISASVVNDTNSTARLVFKSSETGEENQINLVDITGTLMHDVRMLNSNGNRRQTDGTAGGFLKQDASDLNANLTMDGIEIIKSSNEISDIIEGVTISLHQAQEPDATELNLVVEADTSNAKVEVEDFIKKYNEITSYLNAKTAVDTTSFVRGEFAGDYVFSNLKYSLRGMATGQVEGLDPGKANYLSKLGITIDRQGIMSISDKTKFDEQVDQDIDNVIGLFTGENGIGSKIETLLDRFVDSGGTVDRSKEGVTRQLKSIDTRIDNYEARLAVRRQSLERQYMELQKTLSMLNSQQSMMSSIYNQNFMGGGY